MKPQNPNPVIAAVPMVLVFIVFLFAGCSSRQDKRLPAPPSAAFSRYISAFSGGVLPTDEVLTLRMAFDVVDSTSFGKPVQAGLFRIRPDVSGIAVWKDARTLEFRPEQKFPHDQVFNVTFFLGRLLNVEETFKEFRFGFVTMPQSASVHINQIQVYAQNQQPRIRMTGMVETADAADPESVRQMISLKNGFGDGVEVVWQHGFRNRRHIFTISNIPRANQQQELQITWDAKVIDARDKGVESVTLPPAGVFGLVNAHLLQTPQPRISLQFSEPLQQQNLAGLVYFADRKNLTTRVEGNELLIFPDEHLTGRQILTVEASLTDAKGSRLTERILQEFHFEEMKPMVRLAGRGVIIPASSDLLFPFEAVNLAAVDVDVVRIFEDNVLQFLQANRLDGEEQLRRVGRIIARKTLPLHTGNSTNLNHWNRYAIDLAEIIDPEPGAIYRVYISFRKEYSLFPCDGEAESVLPAVLNSLDTNWEAISDEVSFWGSYGEQYYYYDYDFDWRERENPCHPSYYRGKTVSRNVMASNLGVIARRDTDGTLHFTVSNLLTTEPVRGARIELFNFQRQLLTSATTTGDGFASLQPGGVPFAAIVSEEEQKTYLRLDDGNALSMSMFDVDGSRVNQGLKAYIYGERGVWRPGDTLFLNLMLQDRQQNLPMGYPVVFNLLNPMGQRVMSAVNKEGLNGIYHFKAHTHPDAPTGNYTAVFKVGAVEFAKSLRIETIMPNRLRINTSFDEKGLTGFAPSTGSLSAEWLHGGTARNLRAEVTLTLNPSKTTFEGHRKFVFDDPTRSFQGETFPVFQGRLDASGNARLRASIDLASRAPGRLMAAIETKVFEEGGAFSIDRFMLPFHSYKTYAGVGVPAQMADGNMLVTDSLYTLHIVNVDQDGNLVSNGNVKVDIYKVGWRWWWESSGEYFGDFSASSHHRPVFSQTLRTNNGKASVTFGIQYPDWGRYLVLVTDQESGHRAGDFLYIDWPSWYGGSREGRQQAAAMLSFQLDKEKYAPGEDIVISFPSSEGGRALVSLENGSGVLQRQWVKTRKDNARFTIRATSEMAPNVYAHITLVQPHAQTINDLPIRLYGVMPILVEDPATRLEPEISMPEILKPEQEVTITVKENKGRAMTYTLAMVDEGLLDLTRFPTPNPWGHFFAREALGVKSFDMYDYVMGAFGSEFSRLLGIGGDDFIQPPLAGERASRFRPVVRFFGPVALERNKSQNHTFTMPQYAGSVRVMVVASHQGAYGNVEKTVPVRQSLMALGTLPRVMGPGETVSLPVNVFALDESVREADIAISVNDLLTISGQNSATVRFSEPGDLLQWFTLESAGQEGVAKVSVQVKSGSESVSFDIELDVRNPNPRQTSVYAAMLEAGQTQTVSFPLTGMPATREAVLEVSSIPSLNLHKRMRFLTGYPHGCTEQIISGAFPQLYLETFSSLSEAEKTNIQHNVESVIQRLSTRQASNGGMVMWPGGKQANMWVTSYAGHFLHEARKKGYAVSDQLLNNWERFQKDMANRWTPDVQGLGNDHTQAYRLYTLALVGKPEIGAMNRLRLRPDLSQQARWQLAAAYLLAGQQDAAVQIVDRSNTDLADYGLLQGTFGTPLRDKSMIAMVLNKMNRRTQAVELIMQIAGEVGSDRWLSTQATAFALVAIADFYQGTPTADYIRLNAKPLGQDAISVDTESLVFSQNIKLNPDADNMEVRLENKAESPVFTRVIYSGIPAAGKEQAEQANLAMQVRFTRLNGSTIDVSNLSQGTPFLAEVTIANPGTRGNYTEMALTRIFPPGWEISNIRMDASAAAIQQDTPTYEDVRDDRVLTYFDLPANQSRTFKVMLTATYEGRFYLPGFHVEAMYDASVYARNAGMWVEVKRED